MRVTIWAIFVPAALWAQSAIPPASELHDPPGQEVLFKLHTLPTSVQIYTCKGGAWSGPDPDAIVSDDGQTITIHHYKGPVWEATDGSLVHGSNAKHFQAKRSQSVDWLELMASGGTKKFAGVRLIHRVETSGGIAPASECDAAHDQQQVRVPYSATYMFFGQK